MKTCFCCKRMLKLSQFYAHPQMGDGHLNKCKDCVRTYTNKRRSEVLVHDPKWREWERERCREKRNRYASLTTSEARQKWLVRNPEKVKAQRAAKRAVKLGLLINPQYCEVCGLYGKRLEKHHDDYSKPLSVRWLCVKCHGVTRRLGDKPIKERN